MPRINYIVRKKRNFSDFASNVVQNYAFIFMIVPVY